MCHCKVTDKIFIFNRDKTKTREKYIYIYIYIYKDTNALKLSTGKSVEVNNVQKRNDEVTA